MNKSNDNGRFYIRLWLMATAFMVFAMAVIGAITRLTESGLSMVEWRPLIGAVPPLNEAEWNRVFALYRETPEYRLINTGMSLEEFKTIFFWEWLHRLWGRLIGLVYAVPLVFFWIKGMIPPGYKKPFAGLLILGGLQGAMGWFMVMSGLVDRPSVSHYRLAAHLSLAFIIFGCLIWMIYSISPKIKPQEMLARLRLHGWVASFLVALTIVWGAFVAGLDAGMIYNSFPHMGEGRLIPEDMWFLSPAWLNIFENAASVQFVHRWLAVTTLVMVGSFAWRMRSFVLGGMVLLQVGLGIATLLSQVAIPLAALHQAGAFLLLMLLLRDIYRIKDLSY